MQNPIKETLEAFAAPVCATHGVELVDINYVREPGGGVVRVFIDRERPGGEGSAVSVEDCKLVSRELGAALELADAIKGAYHLEVSSPGLDRPLVKLRDFERFVGREAKVQTQRPIVGDRRKFQGLLLGCAEGNVRIDQDGTEVTIPFGEIAKANLVYRF